MILSRLRSRRLSSALRRTQKRSTSPTNDGQHTLCHGLFTTLDSQTARSKGSKEYKRGEDNSVSKEMSTVDILRESLTNILKAAVELLEEVDGHDNEVLRETLPAVQVYVRAAQDNVGLLEYHLSRTIAQQGARTPSPTSTEQTEVEPSTPVAPRYVLQGPAITQEGCQHYCHSAAQPRVRECPLCRQDPRLVRRAQNSPNQHVGASQSN